MAKFKVGDKVQMKSAKSAIALSTVWTVKNPDHGYFTDKPGVLLQDKWGKTTATTEDNLKAANACSCKSTNAVVQNALDAKSCNAVFKKGDKVVLPIMDGGKRVYTVEEVDRNGKIGWYLVVDDRGCAETVRSSAMKAANATACNAGSAMVSRYGSNWYYAWADGSKEGKEGPFKTAEEAEIAAKQDGFKVVNSTACNKRHFEGDGNGLAEEIAKQFMKWDSAPEGKKSSEFDKLNTKIRAAMSLGGGVWVMRDGTIAITKDKPRGAQNINEYIRSMNSTVTSTNPVVANALKAGKPVACNGIGDCFSDAAQDCKDALRGDAKSNLQSALREVEYVTSYDWANAKDKAGKAKCVTLIKAALAKPTPENIKKAEAACTAERKRADNESISAMKKAVFGKNSVACNLAPSVIKARDKVKSMSESEAKSRLDELVKRYKSGASMPSSLGAELDYLCDRFGKKLDDLVKNAVACNGDTWYRVKVGSKYIKNFDDKFKARETTDDANKAFEFASKLVADKVKSCNPGASIDQIVKNAAVAKNAADGHELIKKDVDQILSKIEKLYSYVFNNTNPYPKKDKDLKVIESARKAMMGYYNI